MSGRASGKYAYGICDRSGFRYKLEDLVYEVQHGERTGLRVGYDMLDPDHPQNFIGQVNTSDPQSLYNPRPDVDPGRALWGWKPVWNPAQYMVGSVGKVTVTTTDGG